MLRMLQATVLEVTAPKIKQAALVFPVVLKPFSMPLFVLRIVPWPSIAMCLYPDDALAAYLVILDFET